MRVVIIGAGQVGSAITEALAGEKADVVAIDTIKERLDELADTHDIQTVHGSGSNPEILTQADISSADMIVAVTNSDEVNMVACAISRIRAPHALTVARVRQQAFLEDASIFLFSVTAIFTMERV